METNALNHAVAEFDFRKRTLIHALAPLDLTDATLVQNFDIGGTEPPGTSRRIIFNIDGNLFRFVNGVLDPYPYHGNLDDILIYGNTVAELLELVNIKSLCGKKIYPVIALDAPADADVFPKIKIAVKWLSFNDLYTVYKYSPVFELEGEKPRITRVSKAVQSRGNATEVTECRLKKSTGWSDWTHFLDAENQIATAIQFRSKFVLSTLDGTDAVNISAINVDYIANSDGIAADFLCFFTKLQNYDADLHTCYLLVKHSPLENCVINAFVSFTPIRKRVENFLLGAANGDFQIFTLPNDLIAQDSLHVEIDGVPTFNFDFDTAASSIALQAPAGALISAYYDFFTAENWLQMLPESIAPEKTRFTYRTFDNNLREGIIKFTVEKKRGQIETRLAVGNGVKSIYALEHFPHSLTCNVPFKLRERILETLAPIDFPISINYNFAGVFPVIAAFSAGFAV